MSATPNTATPNSTGTFTTVMPKDCPFCHKANKPIRVNYDDYLKWQGGSPIQNAMPYLTADERELLMTGICDDCWPVDPSLNRKES